MSMAIDTQRKFVPRLTTSKDTARDSQLNTHVATERIDGTLGHERRRRYPIEDLKENRNRSVLT